jgi:ankyrin repeat protein
VLPSSFLFLHKEEKGEYDVIGEAAKQETPACLQVLLDFNVDVDRRDATGRTGLMVAAKHKSVECMRSLLSKNASPSLVSTDENRETAIHACTTSACMQLLLDAKVDVNERNKRKETALHHVSLLELPEDCVRLLLKYKADVDALEEYKDTPTSPLRSVERAH